MHKPKVLVVDDELRMRDLIRLYLSGHFTLVEAADGLEGLSQFRLETPDLILLDVMMPNLDGWSTLRRIREESAVPVIMLTALGEVSDRIQGLRMGADDYLPKPFDGRELVARIEALLRRVGSLSAGQTLIHRGELLIHPQERRASWKGNRLSLTPKEFDLLTLLAAHPGQAFARERLLDRIWGPDFEGEVRTVDSHIKNLRLALGDGADLIGTVWGIGYRFIEIRDEAANAKA